MTKFLIIGLGTIGYRHFESLYNSKKNYHIHCFDISKKSIERVENLIKSKKNDHVVKIIKRIGYSIYDINLLEKKNYPKPDVLQIPINIFDQRFLKTKYNNKYYKKNTTIVARSIFLQGKLLSSPDKFFSKIENTHYTKFYNFLRLNNISAMSFIKSFYASVHTIDKIILGISDLKNLKDFVNSNYKIYSLKTFNAFSTNNKKIIDPRKW